MVAEEERAGAGLRQQNRPTARARARKPAQRPDGRVVTPEERRAFDLLEMPVDATRHDLRARYKELFRTELGSLLPDPDDEDALKEEIGELLAALGE